MATQVQEANCVLRFRETKSVTGSADTIPERDWNESTYQTIYAWYKQFTQSNCLYKGKSSGGPAASEVPVGRMWQTLICSSRKSTRRPSREIAVPWSKEWQVIKKIQAAPSSETSVSYHITTRRHNSKDRDLNLHRRENLKS
jgi:hypothetical protein